MSSVPGMSRALNLNSIDSYSRSRACLSTRKRSSGSGGGIRFGLGDLLRSLVMSNERVPDPKISPPNESFACDSLKWKRPASTSQRMFVLASSTGSLSIMLSWPTLFTTPVIMGSSIGPLNLALASTKPSMGKNLSTSSVSKTAFTSIGRTSAARSKSPRTFKLPSKTVGIVPSTAVGFSKKTSWWSRRRRPFSSRRAGVLGSGLNTMCMASRKTSPFTYGRSRSCLNVTSRLALHAPASARKGRLRKDATDRPGIWLPRTLAFTTKPPGDISVFKSQLAFTEILPLLSASSPSTMESTNI
mmetsp:Transcript_9889/g.30233  ORF Transcript_9889/g.30233 Transcript_9889/m.30233 type:complete len:301 (+) Transcript_9889:3887-4789(+)